MPGINRNALGGLVMTLFLLTACGGGGGGGGGGSTGGTGSTPNPTPMPSGPTYTPGVFAASSTFKDRCEVPRSGVDIEGTPFPDMAGSTVEENFWLRSWTEETYLWNDEVQDRNPYDFNDPVAFFDLLKTNMITPSGAPKDDFHFSQSTEVFLEQRNATPRASYGANYISFSDTPPRDFRILYTEPGSPAQEQSGGRDKFVRGARILEINGIDFVNANSQSDIDALNDALSPANPGETNTFRMSDPDGTVRFVTVTSGNVGASPVNRTQIITTPTGKVGYVLLNTFSAFSAESQLVDAINTLDGENVTDLVLDLRYNGGGLLAIASQLSYMIAGPVRTNGRIYERLRFNDDAGNTNPVLGGTNDPLPFFDETLGFSLASGASLPDLNLSRVYILSTEFTCSASESIINAMRGIGVEVVLIGSTTCGKPFGFYPQDNCGTTYYTIQFQGVNDLGFGDYADGFIPNNSSASFGVRVPGCEVADDYFNELGDPNEAMLAAALQYRTSTTCPTPPVSVSAALRSSGPSAGSNGTAGTPILLPRSIFDTNRDMRMPENFR